MNDQMMNEGSVPWRMLQLTTWLEWLQTVLYCLLAVALICVLLALIDLALLYWKEFHSTPPQQAATATPQPIQPVQPVSLNAEADCVRLLLDKGDDPNLSNKADATALMRAVNDLKKVQLLLVKGANVNVVSKQRETMNEGA
ncbi:MAG TPA: ankyrin repeat domain-containing protein [Blastocatellia bacterium]|nr:ankyrin repeat domain-containing protein [Blastocatellia bacterium]